MTIFSENLRNLRKKKGLTQRELGDVLGIGQTTVANYEQGARFPDSEMLVKIADYFSVSLDYLLGRNMNPTPPYPATETIPRIYPGGRDDSARLSREPDRPLKESEELHSQRLSELLLSSIIHGQPQEGADGVLQFAQDRQTIELTYRHILEPVLHRIGDLWEQGQVDVYTEHLASQTIRNIMANLRTRVNQAPKKNRRFLAMAASGELHDIGLQMASDFLYMDGWDTFFLGTYLPSQETLKAIHSYNPHVLGISVTMPHHIDSTANIIGFLRSHLRGDDCPRIILGGRAFALDPDLWKTLGADGLARDSQHTVELANHLTA
ncbi:helix-turn-helix domain-containing protein [Spirochaeta lutea]|uniref:helix-turn-helix domain-containing protein n=1 Tax=Spirochaeta lutea TaxID=1480694 RepID=UPI0006919901|nr:helix-turn-helix domain-containing protein [Spirochaeta lutea]